MSARKAFRIFLKRHGIFVLTAQEVVELGVPLGSVHRVRDDKDWWAVDHRCLRRYRRKRRGR